MIRSFSSVSARMARWGETARFAASMTRIGHGRPALSFWPAVAAYAPVVSSEAERRQVAIDSPAIANWLLNVALVKERYVRSNNRIQDAPHFLQAEAILIHAIARLDRRVRIERMSQPPRIVAPQRQKVADALHGLERLYRSRAQHTGESWRLPLADALGREADTYPSRDENLQSIAHRMHLFAIPSGARWGDLSPDQQRATETQLWLGAVLETLASGPRKAYVGYILEDLAEFYRATQRPMRAWVLDRERRRIPTEVSDEERWVHSRFAEARSDRKRRRRG